MAKAVVFCHFIVSSLLGSNGEGSFVFLDLEEACHVYRAKWGQRAVMYIVGNRHVGTWEPAVYHEFRVLLVEVGLELVNGGGTKSESILFEVPGRGYSIPGQNCRLH